MRFAIALLAFASLGLPDGVLGVAWPSVRATFALPLGQLGVLLTATMVGYLGSSFATGWLTSRLGVARLLVWSSGLMVTHALAHALAPRWSVMVVSGLLAGLGAGAIDGAINAFAAARFPPRLVSWLHAAYGVGAMLGPLLMTAVLARHRSWREGYALLGAMLAAMTVAFALTRHLWTLGPARSGREARAPGPAPGLLATLRRPRVWVSVALFFVYTGIEAAAGQWAYSLFTEARGVVPATAGLWAAGYWGALTLGRLGFGALADRHAPRALLRVGMLGAPVAALVLWLGPGSVSGLVGLLALGVSLAPIYPLLVASTPDRVGEADTANAIGFQVAGTYLGAAALPGVVGVLAHQHGLEVIGPILASAALVLLVAHELAARGLARPLRRPVAAPARG
jgi:fucose permease